MSAAEAIPHGMPDSLDALLDDYLRALIRQARSPETVRTYRWAISDLIRQVGRRPLTRELLEGWQDQLLARGLRPRSRSLMAAAVRSWLKWCAVRRPGQLPADLWMSMETVHQPRARPRPLSPADFDLLLSYMAPRRPRATEIHLRDRSLFLFLVATGARISEALQLRRDSFAADLVVRQKGGSEKILLAPPNVREAIEDYLEVRKDDLPWLWITYAHSVPAGRLSRDAAREIWERLARKVGVARFTTHQLRHTCATLLLDQGVPIDVVAEHLGHHGLGTVQRYAEIRPQRRQLAVEVMNGALHWESEYARPLPRLRPSARRR